MPASAGDVSLSIADPHLAHVWMYVHHVVELMAAVLRGCGFRLQAPSAPVLSLAYLLHHLWLTPPSQFHPDNIDMPGLAACHEMRPSSLKAQIGHLADDLQPFQPENSA